jgi:hypothetical protein
LENKDTWFTLRKIARERGLSGWLNYDVLLYGEGKKITDRMGRLADYDQWVLGGKNIYYYFGDLDWEGIRIYKDLVAKNPDLEIRLCVRLYRAMLANGMIQELPLMKAGQKACDFGDFLDGFEDYEKEMILGTLQAGHYIPQEILGYPWFIQQMERIE